MENMDEVVDAIEEIASEQNDEKRAKIAPYEDVWTPHTDMPKMEGAKKIE